MWQFRGLQWQPFSAILTSWRLLLVVLVCCLFLSNSCGDAKHLDRHHQRRSADVKPAATCGAVNKILESHNATVLTSKADAGESFLKLLNFGF